MHRCDLAFLRYAPCIHTLKPNTFELSNAIRCDATRLSFLVHLVVVSLLRNPSPELEVGRILFWYEAMTELHLEFTQLFLSFAPRGKILLPFDSNILELSNALRCHKSRLPFLVQLALVALLRSPSPKLGITRILDWYEAVAKLNLEFTQLLTPFVPSCIPFESNLLDVSNALRCHRTWLSFLVQLVEVSLLQNPPTELGVGRVFFWHETDTELCLVFAQLLKSYAPISLACPPVETNTIECPDVLSCHRS